jgi:TonB dependent receptor-like, beta-barrel/Carboxypeptidase regulatory-like domain
MRSVPAFVVVVMVLTPHLRAQSGDAFAQTSSIAGIVLDDRTSRPIGGVLVYVENPPAASTTDANGRFTLAVPPGRYTITASVIGYALLHTDIDVGGAPVEMTIRLSEGAGAYTERVTVSGSLRGDSDTVAGATSLHGRELENLRGAVLDDPLRAIQALPSATATDDFYSEFAVRGNPFRYVGLVVDGVPTQHLMHAVNGITDGGSIAMINSEVLGSVALLPGSYPQRTGRRLGGEVDLVTREGQRDRFHGRAGLSGTSAAFLGEGPLAGGKGAWLASVRRSYLDYVIKRIDPGAGFAFGFVDAQAKAVYDLTTRHQVTMSALFGRARFDEGDPDIGFNEIRTGVSRAWLAAVSWRYVASSRFAITQRLYSTGLRFDNDNRAGATIDDARSAELGWRADASLSTIPGLVIEFGGDLARLDGRSTIVRQLSATGAPIALNDYDRRAAAASVYGQVRVNVGSRLTLTPGGRVDHWSVTTATATSPWVNAEWRVGERTRLRGGAGIYRQFPDLDAVYGLNGGGLELKPERARHLDGSVEQMLPRETRVAITVYRRSERDVLWRRDLEPRLASNGRVQPGTFDAPWRNALSGDAHGVEVVLRRDTADGFSGWAGYGFGHLRYTDTQTGERFWADADQRHTVSLYGNYRLSSRSSVSARYRYGSNYPIVGYIGEPAAALGQRPFVDDRPLFYGLSTDRNALRLPAYSRLDVRGDRAFNWSRRRLVVFVDVANILNRTNLRNASYSVDRAGRVFETTESLMPIVPSGGLTIEF